jgi:hypothetical protein
MAGSSHAPRIILIVIVVLIALGAKFFYVDKGEVRTFNNKLVEMVLASDGRYEPLTALLDPYYGGSEVDVAALGEAQQSLEKSITDDRDELRGMSVPDNEACQKFHGACVEYVENSLAVAQRYAQVIEYVEAHNPASGEQDGDAIGTMLAELLEQDEKLFGKVTSTQKEMADKFNLKLE